MADKQPPPLMGATAIRPPDRVGAEKYTHILYDPKNGTILTRTPKSWGLIILFYCIYYSCLAAFWLACMKIFLTIQIQDPSVLDTAKPTWTKGDSIIGVRPGIGIRPLQTYEEVDSGIYELDMGDVPADPKQMAKDYAEYKVKNLIDDEDDKWIMDYLLTVKGSKGYAYRTAAFFKVYNDNKKNGVGKLCNKEDLDKDGYRKPGVDLCQFDINELQACKEYPYGYSSKDGKFKPCVFVKMNRIMDLKPPAITSESKADESITKDASTLKIFDAIKKADKKDRVYINCEGSYPADKEGVTINVFPSAGLSIQDDEGNAVPLKGLGYIPLKYFPYSQFRKGGNESPMIAVQFSGLENAKGRLIHVMCKAFFDGVIHSKKDKAGLVQFEVFLNK